MAKEKTESAKKITNRRFKWTPAFDAILSELVETFQNKTEFKINLWSDVASEFKARLINMGYKHSYNFPERKSCRERWSNRLDPSKYKGPFTDDELIILLYMKEKGLGYSEIAKELNRTQNDIKNKCSILKGHKYKKIRDAVQRLLDSECIDETHYLSDVAEPSRKRRKNLGADSVDISPSPSLSETQPYFNCTSVLFRTHSPSDVSSELNEPHVDDHAKHWAALILS